MIKAIRHEDENLKMPEKGKLAADDIALLTEWVKAGAPGRRRRPSSVYARPAKSRTRIGLTGRFSRSRRSSSPATSRSNPIDRFIQARLQKEGLRPSPAADPRVLIRRMTFDVIGLPPTPQEIEAFLAEYNAASFRPEREEKRWPSSSLIDRLLASPHYGERQARLWLDLVRFAESDGYRLDSFRPHAWRYRDYVIKSFNDDKPYDRFVREQLAGDELYPDDPDGLVAIGFLTHGIYEFNQRDVRGQWNSILSEATDVTSEVFLGLSMGCARCHDHKFDPILQKDYYSLRAFFEGLLPSDEVPYAASAQLADHEIKQRAWLEKDRQDSGRHRGDRRAGACQDRGHRHRQVSQGNPGDAAQAGRGANAAGAANGHAGSSAAGVRI